MNKIQLTLVERVASVAQAPIGAAPDLPAPPSRLGRLPGRALGIIGAVAILLSPAAFGADPAGETTKVATAGGAEPHRDSAASTETAGVAGGGDLDTHRNPLFSKAMIAAPTTGGVDPHGDSWESIKNSLRQFAHPEFVLRLFLSLVLAVGCSWVIAWHPRSLRRGDSSSDLEERKALIILAVAGAIVAELGGIAPTLAFVIFGIGALLRFRTVLDNPKATGKAILVVVIGLASGMGSWAMAVFVTIFSWALLFWLDSHVTCNMTIRLDGNGDPKPLQNMVQSLLASHRCRVQSCELSKGRKRMEFRFRMPAGLDQDQLEADVRAKLPKTGDTRITIEAV